VFINTHSSELLAEEHTSQSLFRVAKETKGETQIEKISSPTCISNGCAKCSLGDSEDLNKPRQENTQEARSAGSAMMESRTEKLR